MSGKSAFSSALIPPKKKFALSALEAVAETLRSGGIAALFRRYYGGQPMNVLEYLREYGSRLLLLGRQARCAADAAAQTQRSMTIGELFGLVETGSKTLRMQKFRATSSSSVPASSAV